MKRTPLTIEWSLLGLIHQQPMHGYELHQRLSNAEGLGLVWRLKQSQLYALLSRLEARGYLSATLESQEPRPPRKVFSLTTSGRDAFLEWVQSPVSRGRDFRMEFLAKLYFAHLEGKTTVQHLLERQREACQNWKAAQEAEADTSREAAPYQWLVYQFRIGQMQAMLDWLDTCEQTLFNLTPEDRENEPS